MLDRLGINRLKDPLSELNTLVYVSTVVSQTFRTFALYCLTDWGHIVIFFNANSRYMHFVWLIHISNY